MTARNDGETFIITRHLERLRTLIEQYRGWCNCDNDAEAIAMVIADCRLLLRDLDVDPDEVGRFVTAVNLRRVSRFPDEIDVPGITCESSIDDLDRPGDDGSAP